MDQSDVAEIVRHLVDEERRALSVNARILDEAITHFSELIRVQIVEHLRITALAGLSPPQFMREREDIRQFQRPIDL